jgi:rhodanese-related sulfurtransferase
MSGTTVDQPAPTISADSLRQRLRQPSDLVVLDVRTPGEFATGHIPGALNLPVDQLPAHATRVAAADRALVLVCQSGARADTAQRQLSQVGASGTQVLTGGMGAWTAAGGDATPPSGAGRWSLERQVRLTAGSIVVSGILGSLVWPKARFLSGAIGAGLVFSAVTNTCGMGAVLAKLPYNRGADADIDAALAQLDR